MKKVEPKKVVNPLFEKRTKNFAIGKLYFVVNKVNEGVFCDQNDVKLKPELPCGYKISSFLTLIGHATYFMINNRRN